ncbi:hypothetical protein VPHK71_0006 [Vibrio phage K71]|nr:hypothetical protein SIPHO078v2_p0006 [Vibrio phage 14E30.1]QZI92454.1 hypothetical protein SIPHO058v2_p0006 [Vibrio phage 14E30.2]
MEFFVNLIRATEQDEPSQREELEENCTHITKDYWFFEGDIDYLEDCGVRLELLEESVIVGSLGDLTESELIDLAGIAELREALSDVIDGCSECDLNYQTGLSIARCQEIMDISKKPNKEGEK